MTSEVERILNAKIDYEFYRNPESGRMSGMKVKRVVKKIYLASDDVISKGRDYIHIRSADVEIFLPEKLVRRLITEFGGDEKDERSI